MQATSLFLIIFVTATFTGSYAWTRHKLIVDVDVGVDDGFALSLLLAADSFNEVEILAITTVSGNTDVRNASLNALKVLHTAGRLDIPVFEGSKYALDKTPDYDYFFGYDGFGDVDYPDAPNASFIHASHGVLAMLQVVKDAPGEIVLVCLGPLTNYAIAARLDPTFSQSLAQVVVLGGSAIGMGNVKPGLEFNFYFDPLAAAIMFRAPKKTPTLLVPWETVAIQAALPLEWRIGVLGALPGPVMALLNAAEQKHLSTLTDTWNCGDLLAAAVLVNPELITLAELQHLDVEVHAASLAGATIVDYAKSPGLTPNAVIVKSIDLVSFQEMLLQYLAS